jgi:hypothetical protein
MDKIVISMSPERRNLLNYTYTHIPAESEATDFVKENMSRRHNQDINSKRFKGKCGCFTSHMKVLRYIVNNKINNVVVLEDDALLKSVVEPYGMSNCDSPVLLGGSLCHPSNWKYNNEFIKKKVYEIIFDFEYGINKINYDKYRFTGAWAIYYPKWKHAQQILDFIYENKKLTHFDIYLSKNKLIKYLHYPSLYVHNDLLLGSQIGDAPEGIIDNYIKNR